MRKATISELWDRVIKHWEENVERVEKGDKPRLGCLHCAFCVEFNIKSSKTSKVCCIGCPIAEWTGQEFCKGTPYVNLHNLSLNVRSQAQVVKAVQAELTFLKGLREKRGE